MKPMVLVGRVLMVGKPGAFTRKGLRALVNHARSGAGWGDDEEPGLERQVEAACRWIDAALAAEKEEA